MEIGCFRKQFLLFLYALLSLQVCSAIGNEQQLNHSLRAIGHEFLLQLGDSSSRVLPVTKVEGRYKIEFENEFQFIPEMLSSASQKVIDSSSSIKSYLVEVENCEKRIVVHSFKVDVEKDASNITCKARAMPIGCYVVYFTVLESNNIALADTNGNVWSWSVLDFIFLLMILLFVLGLLLYFKRKNNDRESLNPHLINIGQYQFDQKGMILTLKAQSIDLSSTESDLLYLLFSNENKTLEREYILKMVWGDSGDYVGRTLDVFISKLRKKLEADESLKIINVRGVGYRFVMN